MRLPTLLLCVVAVIVGCKSVWDDLTEQQQIAMACASASAAIKTLTVMNNEGRLSVDQQDGVLQAITITDPICTAPHAPVLNDARRSALLQAAAYLQAEAAR